MITFVKTLLFQQWGVFCQMAWSLNYPVVNVYDFSSLVELVLVAGLPTDFCLSDSIKSPCYCHHKSRDVKWEGNEKLSFLGLFLVLGCVDTGGSTTHHHQHPVCRDVAAATPLTVRKTTDNHMTSDPFTRCASSISWCILMHPLHWTKLFYAVQYGNSKFKCFVSTALTDSL